MERLLTSNCARIIGVLVRGFQLGVLNRPLSSGKAGYVYSAAFWTGLGYVFYKVVDHNDALIEQRVNQLQDARAKFAKEQ